MFIYLNKKNTKGARLLSILSQNKNILLSSNTMSRRNEVFHLDFNQDQGRVYYYIFKSPLTSDPVVKEWNIVLILEASTIHQLKSIFFKLV